MRNKLYTDHRFNQITKFNNAILNQYKISNVTTQLEIALNSKRIIFSEKCLLKDVLYRKKKIKKKNLHLKHLKMLQEH